MRDFALGAYYTLVLLDNGQIYAFGLGANGQVIIIYLLIFFKKNKNNLERCS